MAEDYSQSSQSDSESSSDSDSEVEAQVHARGEFFGCYLLVSESQERKLKGRTYIGFTVDPNRRLKQHNGGHSKGGARKTSGKGPWAMVLIIHGFPNHIAALRFEWAWQNPGRSRRLGKAFARKKRNESPMEYRFRVLTEMLSVGPWNGLPLTIRWLRPEFQLHFPPDKRPPDHMPLAYGLVDLAKTPKPNPSQKPHPSHGSDGNSNGLVGVDRDECPDLRKDCRICHVNAVGKCLVDCYYKPCVFSAHITCLASKLTSGQAKGARGSGRVIPVQGSCPDCGRILLWGELVRRCKATQLI